jgi:hypothetical protein
MQLSGKVEQFQRCFSGQFGSSLQRLAAEQRKGNLLCEKIVEKLGVGREAEGESMAKFRIEVVNMVSESGSVRGDFHSRFKP